MDTIPIDLAGNAVISKVMDEVAIINKNIDGLIVTDETATLWADNLFAFKQAIKKVDDERKDLTKPIDETKKKLLEKAREFTDPMRASIKIVEKALLFYQEEKERKEAETNRLAREQELDRLRAAQEELEEQADINQSEHAMEEAVVVEKQIEAVEHEDVSGSSKVQSKRTTSSVTKKWVHDLVDFSKVPDEYKMLNTVKVNKMISGEHGTHEIPGLDIYQKSSIISRRR